MNKVAMDIDTRSPPPRYALYGTSSPSTPTRAAALLPSSSNSSGSSFSSLALETPANSPEVIRTKSNTNLTESSSTTSLSLPTLSKRKSLGSIGFSSLFRSGAARKKDPPSPLPLADIIRIRPNIPAPSPGNKQVFNRELIPIDGTSRSLPERAIPTRAEFSLPTPPSRPIRAPRSPRVPAPEAGLLNTPIRFESRTGWENSPVSAPAYTLANRSPLAPLTPRSAFVSAPSTPPATHFSQPESISTSDSPVSGLLAATARPPLVSVFSTCTTIQQTKIQSENENSSPDSRFVSFVNFEQSPPNSFQKSAAEVSAAMSPAASNSKHVKNVSIETVASFSNFTHSTKSSFRASRNLRRSESFSDMISANLSGCTRQRMANTLTFQYDLSLLESVETGANEEFEHFAEFPWHEMGKFSFESELRSSIKSSQSKRSALYITQEIEDGLQQDFNVFSRLSRSPSDAELKTVGHARGKQVELSLSRQQSNTAPEHVEICEAWCMDSPTSGRPLARASLRSLAQKRATQAENSDRSRSSFDWPQLQPDTQTNMDKMTREDLIERIHALEAERGRLEKVITVLMHN